MECPDEVNVDVGSVVEKREENALVWATKGIFNPLTNRYNKMKKLE